MHTLFVLESFCAWLLSGAYLCTLSLLFFGCWCFFLSHSPKKVVHYLIDTDIYHIPCAMLHFLAALSIKLYRNMEVTNMLVILIQHVFRKVQWQQHDKKINLWKLIPQAVGKLIHYLFLTWYSKTWNK